MQSILIQSAPSDQEEIITELWQHGTLGIIEESEGLRAFFDETADLPSLFRIVSGRIIETRTELPPDPADFPKQDWDPILIGDRFWIAPSWVNQPIPPNRIRLAIDNPNAFGTGRHESTQLALEALEQHVTSASTILDIGCGSGILSQAALLLGARNVFSCDIHNDAIASAKPQLQPHLFLGSADSVRNQIGDIVVANISAKVIDALAWELNRITKANGLLILTGFIEDKLPTRFSPTRITERGDWRCWLCHPQPVTQDDVSSGARAHSLQWW